MPADAPPVTVRPMTSDDVVWTAQRQSQLLAHGLFPRLGPAFVRRWHLSHVRSPYGVALLAERAGAPLGYLLGTVDQSRHVSWTLEHEKWPLAVRGALGMIARPRLLALFVRTRAPRYARRLLRVPQRPSAQRSDRPTAPAPAERNDDAVGVVMALAVDATSRGSGAGRALVAQFLTDSAEAGTERCELVTVAGPGGASDFYAALGWEVVGEHRNSDGVLVRRFATPTGRSSGDRQGKDPLSAAGPEGNA